ncbi:unnamed protein product [Symbiodinium natans]|uniref:C2H2-type domain-containing protein n=1 Tax=Symbiodinium natans TaxID=878477 RepID=A0A812LX89_9DINO|nr:unnamed protein product [Symbiodinium natans]
MADDARYHCLLCAEAFARWSACNLHGWTVHGQTFDRQECERVAICRSMPFKELFRRYALAPSRPAEVRLQVLKLQDVWRSAVFQEGLQYQKHTQTFHGIPGHETEFILWYLFAARMFYLAGPHVYHSLGRKQPLRWEKWGQPTYRAPTTPLFTEWPWWEYSPQLLSEPPKHIGKDALLGLVVVHEARRPREDFLEFLEHALSTWWCASREDREDILASLFDMDAIAAVLAFLLEDGGGYLHLFLATVERVFWSRRSRSVVFGLALCNRTTLDPFSSHYATEVRETMEEFDLMEEEDHVDDRTAVPLFNLVCLMRHLFDADVAWKR